MKINLKQQYLSFMNKIDIYHSSKPSTQTNSSIDIKGSKIKNINIMSSEPTGNKFCPIPKSNNLGYCMICLQQGAYGKFTDCDHEFLCPSCAQEILLASIQKNQIPTCHLLFCKRPLCTKSQMFRNFSTTTHLKWKAFEIKQNLLLNSLPIFSCQKPDCHGYVDQEKNCCKLCQQRHCNQCHRISHQGSQCINLSSNLIGFQGLKFCRFCSRRLYKEGGCPKITCLGCDKIICYECLDQWSISHHGCAEYGWFSFIFNYFAQCCSASTVNNHSQILVESGSIKRFSDNNHL